MRVALALFCLGVVLGLPAHARDGVDELLAKAFAALESAEDGDDSAAARRFGAVLERDPEHPEALFQVAWMSLSRLASKPVTRRAQTLAEWSPRLSRIETLARDRKELDLAHYIAARHAALYNAFDQALESADRALAIRPESARYVYFKAVTLRLRGAWRESDADLHDAIALLEKARVLDQRHPTPFVDAQSIEFEVARTLAKKIEPDWDAVALRYRSALASMPPKSRLRSYAWNNVSIAYRKLGQCDKALDAADAALALRDSGSARRNKRYARFCLDMVGMGMPLAPNVQPTQAPASAD